MKRRRRPVDPLEDTDRDVDFHMAVAEASHNVALVHVMRGIFNLRINMLRSPRGVVATRPRTSRCSTNSMPRLPRRSPRAIPAARARRRTSASFVQASLREATRQQGAEGWQQRRRTSPDPARARKRSDGDAGA